MERLGIKSLRIDGGTQQRVHIDQAIVEDYAEALAAGDVFPLVDAFYDGKEYWLADGFYRYHAHVQAGQKHISANVHKGSQRDAILFSCGANRGHGLRRTPEDKRRCVLTLLQDQEWGGRSTSWIAEQAGVSEKLVGKIRPEIQVRKDEPENGKSQTIDTSADTEIESRHYDDSESQIEPEREPPKRTGRDGKKYPAKRKPAKGAKKKPPKEQPEAGGYEPHEAAKPLTKMDALFSKVMEQYSLAEKILGKADPLLKEVHGGLDTAFKALSKLRTKLRRAG